VPKATRAVEKKKKFLEFFALGPQPLIAAD
jgi:hypothetical protein